MSSTHDVTVRDLVSSFAEIPGTTAAAVAVATACGVAFRTRAKVMGDIGREVVAWRTQFTETVLPRVEAMATRAEAATRGQVPDDQPTRWKQPTRYAATTLAAVDYPASKVVAWAEAARAGYDAAAAQAEEVKGRLETLKVETDERRPEVKSLSGADDAQTVVERIDDIVAWQQAWTESVAADRRAIETQVPQLVEATSGGDASRLHDLQGAIEAVDNALTSIGSVVEALPRPDAGPRAG